MFLAADPQADDLLDKDPFALLVGMLLDQQVPMETAFAGPWKLHQRLGGLDAGRIAAMPPEEFAAVCATPPAVHRFPGSMAGRIQTLARTVSEELGGDAARVWTEGDPDAAEVLRRLQALPGFGEAKAKIFLALLGKQRGVRPAGWREAAGPYGAEGSFVSVADIVDETSLARVREAKKAAKAEAKAAKAGSGAAPASKAGRA